MSKTAPPKPAERPLPGPPIDKAPTRDELLILLGEICSKAKLPFGRRRASEVKIPAHLLTRAHHFVAREKNARLGGSIVIPPPISEKPGKG